MFNIEQALATWHQGIGIGTVAICMSVLLFGILVFVIWQFKRHQERMRASESRLRDFAELASDWLWEQDADLRFTWGTGILILRELTNEGFIGKTRWEFADFDQEVETQRWASHKADLAARREFRDFHYQRVGADGRVRHLSASGKPLFDPHGTFVGYRGTGNDITAKVEAEAQLHQAKEAAEAASRSKSEFLAMMSHELRTPLNAVIGFSQLIAEQPFGAINARYIEYANDIHVSGIHLLDLINELLDLSTLDAGRYEIHDERLSLRTIVRICTRMLVSVAGSKKVRMELATSLPDVFLWADRKALKQVLLNLMSNGVKFARPGGVVSVNAGIEVNGDLTISITDTGIGIEPAKLEHVFEPFYQADANTNRQHGGVGLGLAICHKLVTLHGGSIAIESQEGHGTIVRVIFPSSRVLKPVECDRPALEAHL
jgi:PAS domain S-box-containing protein